ncbi:hypothetical protein [Methylobacterium sp. WL9]|uniref:hypothetical protein n=1 Tax=Methylobacterium sp. WL9 TaxID=2603898 RepID=UPI0011CC0721|nr:hypothetical protein [Methylobacterium sp. WL9]TXN25057.1 hypothetical protein FV217_00510 [Methylobacterium sp. WL9]
MNIVFFADDPSAVHASLLADYALNSPTPRRPTAGPGFLAGAEAVADRLPDRLEAASCDGGTLIAALPLRLLQTPSIRERLDLAVVTCGSDPESAERAVDALSSDRNGSTRECPPAWLLPCRRQEWPDLLRVLPTSVGVRRGRGLGYLRSGGPAGATARQALGLAAALLVAAEDPYLPALEPGQVLDILSGQTTAAGLSLRKRLLDLVADLDEAADELMPARATRRPRGRATMPADPPRGTAPRRASNGLYLPEATQDPDPWRTARRVSKTVREQ